MRRALPLHARRAFDRYVARPRFDQVGLAFSVTVVLFVKAFRFL